MDKDVEEYQKKERKDWLGFTLLEWCKEFSRKQIEQIEKGKLKDDEHST